MLAKLERWVPNTTDEISDPVVEAGSSSTSSNIAEPHAKNMDRDGGASGTRPFVDVDEEVELRHWADLRDCQSQFSRDSEGWTST